jgi:DNA-binding NarL/FixJ family response regulator
MNRIRILLADGHENFRPILASFLRSLEGVDLVGEARDDQEAVSKSEELQPDLVLMDVHSQEGNGFEAMKSIKAQRPATKVIAMSPDPDELYERLSQMFADGYIKKSAMKNSLLSLIAGENIRLSQQP